MKLSAGQHLVLAVEYGPDEIWSGESYPQFELKIGMSACDNGLDEDGDSKADWPDDPGCDSPEDPDESDPVPAPICSNGQDDDVPADGFADYSGANRDLGCFSASDFSEAEHSCRGVDALPLGSSTFPLTVHGETSGTSQFDSACSNSQGSPEKAFHWKVPSSGYYFIELIDTNFDARWNVFLSACDVMNDNMIDCRSKQEVINQGFDEGQEVLLVVDGNESDSHGRFGIKITKSEYSFSPLRAPTP